jgi:hypothetical protein
MLTRITAFVLLFQLAGVDILAQGISVIRDAHVFESKALAGKVIFDKGSGISAALVEDCTPGWKNTIASARTGTDGAFSFPNADAKRVHYLRVSWQGANTLLVRVKISPKAEDLILNLTPSS